MRLKLEMITGKNKLILIYIILGKSLTKLFNLMFRSEKRNIFYIPSIEGGGVEKIFFYF